MATYRPGAANRSDAADRRTYGLCAIYDWNILPLGQLLWLKELETYKEFPPLQSPESYNLSQVMEQLKQSRATSHGGD